MKNVELFQGKSVLVVGLAKSGLAAGKLLHKLGANVVVNDRKPLAENLEALELQELGIEVICGDHPLNLLERKFDYIVKNPGIPYRNPLIHKGVELGLPVISELEVTSIISDADIIAITGSNGKTTTTTLIYEMLKDGGKMPLLAGNIGTVACEVAEKATANDILVTEVSSFQLQGTVTFHPKIAVLLNLFEAHLDYHETKENYHLAKGKIFANLTEADYCIVNEDDAEVVKLTANVTAKRIGFSTKIQTNGSYLQNGNVYFQGEKMIEVERIVLPGAHNLENILAAICVAKLAGASTAAIEKVLLSFAGVKHRTQFVAEINGRRFYNDSKATNILATKAAVAAFSEPVILLAGGLDRGNGFDELIPELAKLKGLVVYGETAEKLEISAKKAGLAAIKTVNNVTEAVNVAYGLSESGNIILLSPACASWDQFRTFEERGETFIKAVAELK